MPRVSLSRIAQTWGKLTFVVQPIALPEVALCKHAAGAPRERFLATMKIPVWPFIRMARLAEPLMPDEGSPTLMSYIGAATTSAIRPSDSDIPNGRCIRLRFNIQLSI
jgi:enoyl-[acyl-carrier-protein] reductase (NADH)